MRTWSLNAQKQMASARGPYKCPHCHQQCRTERKLRNHVRNEHVKEEGGRDFVPSPTDLERWDRNAAYVLDQKKVQKRIDKRKAAGPS
jgi:hypothetical protein